MKYILLSFLFLFPSFLFGQAIDSSAIRQVDSLIQVSREFTAKRDFAQALEVNAEAEQIALEKRGKESAEYGSCCFNYGRVLYFKGDLIDSEYWYLKAMAIREKVLSREHPDYAASLNNLAILYKNLGQYEKAEPLFLETISIRGKAPGKEHPFYAGSLYNLANLYKIFGQYEKAEPLYLEAKTILEKALGKEHPQYASTLSGLANLYERMGQYEKTEPIYLEAKTILEKALGKEHPEYARRLLNLGNLYMNIGQYEKAESLLQESKSILEKALGREHYFYASSLYNLANLYKTFGQYEKAEPLYLEAKTILEKALGKEGADYTSILTGLAILYEVMGQYEKAEPIYLEVKALIGKALGRGQPYYAGSLINLASLYRNMGQYEKAEPLLREAIAIFELSNMLNHPFYFICLDNMANLYRVMGQYEKAESIFLELSNANQTLVEKAMLHLSEKELNNYLNLFSQRQDQLLSFTQITNSKKMIPRCYDNSLFYKGFLLKSTSRIKLLALSNTTTAEKHIRLKGYLRRLAAVYAQPIAERDSALVAELEIKVNEVEKDLTRTVAGWGSASMQVQWQEVQAKLQEGEAAIEFVHYRYTDKKETDSIMYAALVLQSGNSIPEFIPLFEEQSLERLLSPLGERRADYVNHLYTVEDRGIKPIGPGKQTLYELIWRPLEKELAEAKTIYYAPSGLLHRLNLGAIPLSDEETLSDRYKLIGMNSTRQLVVPTRVEADKQDAVLFGGIHYEMDSTALAKANNNYDTDHIATRGELSFRYSDSTLRGGSWNYLKWTDKEVDKIAATLGPAGVKTDIRKSYSATEESFKALGYGTPSPRILHLATHGFFFPDPVIERRVQFATGNDEPVFKMSDHPMIRSGLILSGGNYAWQTGQPAQPEMEDGILTAYEISQVNLSNTELVVLSACETGLGDIKGNEGVYGLQRAFKIAGAKYLIMSLWQVPDQETAIFMQTFYKHWIEGKLSIPDAFRTTQREMKERFLNPYQWAGFVLIE